MNMMDAKNFMISGRVMMEKLEDGTDFLPSRVCALQLDSLTKQSWMKSFSNSSWKESIGFSIVVTGGIKAPLSLKLARFMFQDGISHISSTTLLYFYLELEHHFQKGCIHLNIILVSHGQNKCLLFFLFLFLF